MNIRYSDATLLLTQVDDLVEQKIKKEEDPVLEKSLAFILQKRIKNGHYYAHGKPLFNGQSEYLVLKILTLCWRLRMSDREASREAGISRTALSRYLSKNPDIKSYRDDIRNFIPQLAEQALISRLQYLCSDGQAGSVSESLKVLQKVKPDSYSCSCKRVR